MADRGFEVPVANGATACIGSDRTATWCRKKIGAVAGREHGGESESKGWLTSP